MHKSAFAVVKAVGDLLAPLYGSPMITGTIATVYGYCSVFGNVDRVGDIVDPGAFSDWIAELDLERAIPILWAHDNLNLPVGVVTEIAQDAKGLRFTGEILDTSWGRDLVTAMGAGVASGASFAYQVRQDGVAIDENGNVHLTELDLFEVTICSFGANPLAFARLGAVKISDQLAGSSEPAQAILDA